MPLRMSRSTHKRARRIDIAAHFRVVAVRVPAVRKLAPAHGGRRDARGLACLGEHYRLE